jgi:hypothetical protein
LRPYLLPILRVTSFVLGSYRHILNPYSSYNPSTYSAAKTSAFPSAFISLA